MGFLDNRMMRAVEKGLRPYMRGDERLIDADVVNERQFGRTNVVVSNRALYLSVTRRTGARKTGDAVRIPYETIVDLQERGGAVGWQTFVDAYVVTPIGEPRFDLYSAIAAGLDRVVAYKDNIDTPGGRVGVMLRKREEDGPLQWWLTPHGETDLSDARVRTAVEAAVEPWVERHGVSVRWASQDQR